MEIVVNEALRVELSPKGNTAESVLSTDGKLLVEKIIQGALDVIHAIQYNGDAFLHQENDVAKWFESIFFLVNIVFEVTSDHDATVYESLPELLLKDIC